jgi:hypothetical protein
MVTPLGARAAEQQLSEGGLVEWFGPVGHCAVDEPRLAAVANAGAAGPVGGHLAGLGALQQAAVAFVPGDRERRAS